MAILRFDDFKNDFSEEKTSEVEETVATETEVEESPTVTEEISTLDNDVTAEEENDEDDINDLPDDPLAPEEEDDDVPIDDLEPSIDDLPEPEIEDDEEVSPESQLGNKSVDDMLNKLGKDLESEKGLLYNHEPDMLEIYDEAGEIKIVLSTSHTGGMERLDLQIFINGEFKSNSVYPVSILKTTKLKSDIHDILSKYGFE